MTVVSAEVARLLGDELANAQAMQNQNDLEEVMSKSDDFHDFLLYTAPDGAVKVEVFYKDETVWLTQKALAELFGVQVPGIIEWPAVIKPRVTNYPACVMDLFPTVSDIVGLPESATTKPIDGIRLKPVFAKEVAERNAPIGFRYQTKRALIDDRYKLLTDNVASGKCELFDLVADPKESRDLSTEQPEVFARMKRQLLDWNAGMDASLAGKDYPAGRVAPPDPEPVNWYDLPQYQPFLSEWKQRWEFQSYLNCAAGEKKREN